MGSWALGSVTVTDTSSAMAHESVTACSKEKKYLLDCAAAIINDLIHEETRRMASCKDTVERDPSGLSIEKSIAELNPLLWEIYSFLYTKCA